VVDAAFAAAACLRFHGFIPGDLRGPLPKVGPSIAPDVELAALLPIRERVEGSENPRTLWTRDNLAYWTGQAGE
jgi:hypothetical protein